MRFDVITLFPDMFSSFQKTSVLGRAFLQEKLELHVHDLRDFTTNKHKQVDDVPYGGGPGMLLTCQPLWDCIHHVKDLVDDQAPVIYMTPQGDRFTQAKAERAAVKETRVILLCGHYEGIDQRIRDALVDTEWRIGDYVLTGGELASQIIIDAIGRLVPGVLGDDASSHEESFSKSLDRKREYPHYTRPAIFQGMAVPEVLMSGHHAKIDKWRKNNRK